MIPESIREPWSMGWSTWDVRSLFTKVQLPGGYAISFGLKEYADGQARTEWLVGRPQAEAETVWLGERTLLGEEWEASIEWRGIKCLLLHGEISGGWALLIKPESLPKGGATAIIRASILWGRSGSIKRVGSQFLFEGESEPQVVSVYGESQSDPYTMTDGPSLAFNMAEPLVITNCPSPDLNTLMADLLNRHEARKQLKNPTEEFRTAIDSCLAWNSVYDPKGNRILIPVSRRWCLDHGGYVVFCWDTFLAGWMALKSSPELAAHWVLGVLDEATEDGFVPNFSYATGQKSFDRSQPPLGSLVVCQIVKETGQTEFAAEVFDRLLIWNDWWHSKRSWGSLLSWGSNSFEPKGGNRWETLGVNDRFGAALESGLDNSPLYDDLEFDQTSGRSMDADVGLMSLYLLDLQSLIALAAKLGRAPELERLKQRHAHYLAGLESLWCSETNAYLNRHVKTGKANLRMAPTNFYPLFVEGIDNDRCRLLVSNHLLNPDKFWGPYPLPSISRDDSAYADQEYWRGRVWAPLNFLVYLGLRRHNPSAAAKLAEASGSLFLKEWREERHIHENYNAETGDGDDVSSSDAFYHWGALMALMPLMESGEVSAPWTDKMNLES